ncbi:GNAT family N-acetyltransferase [Modestobacter sp. Leaf380]|uniref:GNAT family N-acetyltransferase n=1 Tax=Modestobacter sp. Leaf380 TaxID=1736356 RepID=UPI0006F4695F|nr:GNAT family N-acetyltransferase [Modestobacter sp. Leaf380]KQS66951.1 GCN5 family acetyltransferase [Modestobacter sp. Leaf380]
MQIDVDELRLRPWRPTDLDAVWAALQDPAVRLWNGSGASSLEEATQWLARRSEGEGHVSRAVVARADGGLLGSVSLHSIDPVQLDAEVGYWVVPAARGRRVAPRVVDAVCRWAFAELGLDRVVLAHAVENPASGRVAARAGFTLEGRLRRSYRFGDGVKHDELLWSRLSDDPGPGNPSTP